MPTLDTLINTLPQTGQVRWIGIRPARGATMQVVNVAEARLSEGLTGDRYAGRSGKREVTLIQFEHLGAIASMLGRENLNPALLRRNIVVSGINLLALKNQSFRIGEAILEYTGLCHPCSKMETTLGPGGYNAMRGHGGITARVATSGKISLGDPVTLVTAWSSLSG